MAEADKTQTVASMQMLSEIAPQHPMKEKMKINPPPIRMRNTAAAYKSMPIMVVRKFLSTAIHIPTARRTRPHIYNQ